MGRDAHLKAKLVLLVEDDVLIRMVMAAFLHDRGLIILEAACASEAVNFLDCRKDIDILVTDVEMPGPMDGVELAKHVSDARPDIKVLVISGNDAIEPADLPNEAGFLRKPFADRELWSALEDVAA